MPGSMLKALPDFERLVVALDHVWVLVAFEADAVAGAMDEQLAHARVGDDRARRAVDVLALDARLDRGRAGCLGALKDLVEVANSSLGRMSASPGDPQRARDVRAVARRASRRCRARSARPPAMTRSVGSWCGDAEFGPLATIQNAAHVVALVDEPVAHLARDVRLRPADEPAARDRFDDAVGRVRRLAQQLDLRRRP